MPQVYLRKEAYNRLIESGHAKDLEAFLAHAVELAVEELRQVPKSDLLPEPPMSTSTITEPAPTVTSDVITSKEKPIVVVTRSPESLPKVPITFLSTKGVRIWKCQDCQKE